VLNEIVIGTVYAPAERVRSLLYHETTQLLTDVHEGAVLPNVHVGVYPQAGEEELSVAVIV